MLAYARREGRCVTLFLPDFSEGRLQACQRLGSPSLEGHDVYVLAYPCSMCLGALHYASPDRAVFVVICEEEGRHYRDDQRYFEFGTSMTSTPNPRGSGACLRNTGWTRRE